MNKFIGICAFLLISNLVQAAPAFTGEDFSGVYDCDGDDAKEGKYKGVVTMALNKEHSVGVYGAYSFKLEVPNFGTYLGEAVSEANKAAIYFGLNKPGSTDHGTGMATFTKNANGKFSFTKFYYEAEYKGGNHGSETCTQR